MLISQRFEVQQSEKKCYECKKSMIAYNKSEKSEKDHCKSLVLAIFTRKLLYGQNLLCLIRFEYFCLSFSCLT